MLLWHAREWFIADDLPHIWHWNLGSDSSTMTMTTRKHACHLGTQLANVTSIFRCARACLPQFVFFLLLRDYKPVPRFVHASFIPLEHRPMTGKYRRWRRLSAAEIRGWFADLCLNYELFIEFDGFLVRDVTIHRVSAVREAAETDLDLSLIPLAASSGVSATFIARDNERC